MGLFKKRAGERRPRPTPTDTADTGGRPVTEDGVRAALDRLNLDDTTRADLETRRVICAVGDLGEGESAGLSGWWIESWELAGSLHPFATIAFQPDGHLFGLLICERVDSGEYHLFYTSDRAPVRHGPAARTTPDAWFWDESRPGVS